MMLIIMIIVVELKDIKGLWAKNVKELCDLNASEA